jgi:peptide/nickel transport system substrate-binding protein
MHDGWKAAVTPTTTRRALLAGTAASLAGLHDAPAQAETALRWADTFDPHSTDVIPARAQQVQVYERLLDLDTSLRFTPQLALAWRPVGRLEWEFRLREGVRFHDGSPFTAEDVVFSLERARTPPSQYQEFLAGVEAIAAVDDHTVRLRTVSPAPSLAQNVSNIFVMSKVWAETHGAARAADFKSGEETYASRHADGTGPFVLEAYEPGGHVVLRRNPDWWGYADYPVNVDRIEYAPIADPRRRLAALLAGEIDLLTDPPLDELDRVRDVPGLRLAQTREPRTIFLGMDQGSAELRSSDVRGRNPFRDERVRRALYQAIDVEAIRREVMRGFSRPTAVLVPPGMTGYTEELDRRLPYDPAAAEGLLAEAGYPDGFGITLDCPNNRYVNDEAICRAAAAQLERVGVRVKVDAQPMALHSRKVYNKATDFYLWGYAGFDSEEFLMQLYYGKPSPVNATGYRNSRVDDLIERIAREPVSYIHDALLEEVWRLVRDDIVYLPLHNQMIVWAMRDHLDIPLNPYGYPKFRYARFAGPTARSR